MTENVDFHICMYCKHFNQTSNHGGKCTKRAWVRLDEPGEVLNTTYMEDSPYGKVVWKDNGKLMEYRELHQKACEKFEIKDEFRTVAKGGGE